MTNLADETGSYPAVAVGTDLNVLGKVGSGITFDGATDRVNAGRLGNFGSTHMASGFTIECWAKWTASGARMSLCGVINDGTTTFVELAVNHNVANAVDNGRFTAYLRGDSGGQRYRQSATAGLNDGLWHHLAAGFDGSSWQVYVDGDLDNGTESNTGTLGGFSNFGYDLMLGCRNVRGTLQDFYEGSLDEFAFYPTLLPSSRVLARISAAA